MRINRFICGLTLVLTVLAGCKPDSHQKGPAMTVHQDSVVSDSTKIIYIGTYTESKDRGAGKSEGIYVYEMNMSTGRLNLISHSPHTVNPSYLVVDRKRQRLFAVNETGDDKKPSGAVSAFRLIRQGREMEFVNSVPSEGNFPCYVTLDQSGKWVMCANYGSGTVAVFPVESDGSLGPVAFTDQHKGRNKPPRQESAHAHMIITSPDNQFVYSCDLGSDNIFIYKLDTIQGKLLASGTRYATQAGAGPRHMTFHPSKDIAYEVNELNGTIEVMQVDTRSGALTRLQIVPTVDQSVGVEAACADIHLTPSGEFLYASNRGQVNDLAMYKVDQESGKLTLIGHQTVKGKTPRNFVIDPTGTYLLVANQDSDNVVTFRIDKTTGKLIDTGLETTVPSPVCIKFLL
jgi:6-phosphogluconolactonase